MHAAVPFVRPEPVVARSLDWFESSLDQGPIGFFDGAGAKLFGQTAGGLGGSRDEDDAGEPAEDDAQVTVSAGSGGERRAIGAMVNDYRAQNGLHALERNGTLEQVAQSWAEWMAANQTLQHNPNYRSQIGSGWSAVTFKCTTG